MWVENRKFFCLIFVPLISASLICYCRLEGWYCFHFEQAAFLKKFLNCRVYSFLNWRVYKFPLLNEQLLNFVPWSLQNGSHLHIKGSRSQLDVNYSSDASFAISLAEVLNSVNKLDIIFSVKIGITPIFSIQKGCTSSQPSQEYVLTAGIWARRNCGVGVKIHRSGSTWTANVGSCSSKTSCMQQEEYPLSTQISHKYVQKFRPKNSDHRKCWGKLVYKCKNVIVLQLHISVLSAEMGCTLKSKFFPAKL